MSVPRNISVLIPIFNEEEILEAAVTGLVAELERRFDAFEIVLTENGSRDRTREIMARLSKADRRVRGLTDETVADYGQALIDGIKACKHDEICILELDYLDLGYLDASYPMLADFDLIVGSKKLNPGIDQRPLKRRFFSTGYNTLLKLFFGLTLTETHGLKTLRKSTIAPLADKCVTRHAVFPSELVLRACNAAALRTAEIPLTMPLIEIRTTRISASKRLKKTLDDLRLLRRALKG